MTLLLLVATLASGVAPAGDSRIALIRVHGNHSMADEEVTRIAGLSVGQTFSPREQADAETRLLKSGKFDSVEVRIRYRGLSESSDVALVLLVREKPEVSSRFLAGPLFDLTDEYGLTLGARLAFVDVLNEGSRIAFPLSWGGKRQAGVEGSIPLGERKSFRFDLARFREVNPHYDVPDNRLALGGTYAMKRGLLGMDFSGRWNDVDFGSLHERFAAFGAKLALDSRRDPTIPGDAFYLGLDARRLLFLAGTQRENVDQYVVDLRGFKRLSGQALLASQVYWAVADGALPPYEQPFLGGGKTLRGHAPGELVGDNAAIGSLELRLPLTSSLSLARAGVHFFFDTGAVYDEGGSLRRARFHNGAGFGGFFRIAMIGLRVDLGFNLEGGTRFHVGSGFKF
jgi:outer membrane translocation and assembly module TamA